MHKVQVDPTYRSQYPELLLLMRREKFNIFSTEREMIFLSATHSAIISFDSAPVVSGISVTGPSCLGGTATSLTGCPIVGTSTLTINGANFDTTSTISGGICRAGTVNFCLIFPWVDCADS